MVLKLIGELGKEANFLLNKAIAVSPPVNLHDSAIRFLQPDLHLMQKSFTKALVRLVKQIEKDFPDVKPTHFPTDLSVLEFDELYTAPKWNYQNALEYYEKNSSGKFVPHITLPCRILYSADDPMVSGENIDDLDCPDSVQRFKTRYGGHLGYLGKTRSAFNFRWMDQILIEWLCKNF